MNDVSQKIFLLRSGPGTSEAVEALALAACVRARGRPVAVVLLQDAVLAAVSSSRLESAGNLRELMAGGAACYYLGDDLAMRGHGPAEVLPGCQAVGYSEIVGLLLAETASVTGAF